MSLLENGHISEEQLSAYLEGDLESSETEGLKSHLSACDECSENLEQLEEARSLFQQLPRQSTRVDFSEQVEGRIRRRSRGRFFGPKWQASNKATYLGAAIILVILAALMLLSETTLEIRDDTTGLTGEELGEQNPHPQPEILPPDAVDEND